jgi:hypothetical protein
MPGQPPLGNGILGLDCTTIEVRDPTDLPGVLGQPLIIKAGAVFNVSVRFKFDGALANWLMSTVVPFRAVYYYESFGDQPEGTLGTRNGTTVAGQVEYGPPETTANATLNVPGTYKLTCAVTFVGPPVSAFIEGPMILIA